MKNTKPNKKVIKILCPKCGELMAKIYPWSSIDDPKEANLQFPPCKRCQIKALKKVKHDQ